MILLISNKIISSMTTFMIIEFLLLELLTFHPIHTFDLMNAFIPKQEPTEPAFAAAIDLGSIDIDNPLCSAEITPYLQKCKDDYHEKITAITLEFGDNYRGESAKKASCCGIWEAKQCAIDAANQLTECGHNVSSLYEKLPIDDKIRADVLDKCSEYRENSAICQPNQSSSMFSLNTLITIIVIIMVVTVCILIVFKIIEKRKKQNRTDQYKMAPIIDQEHQYDVHDDDIEKKIVD